MKKYVAGRLFKPTLNETERDHKREVSFGKYAQQLLWENEWHFGSIKCPCVDILMKIEAENAHKVKLAWANCKEIGINLHWDIAKVFMGETNKTNTLSENAKEVDVVSLCNIMLNCKLFHNQTDSKIIGKVCVLCLCFIFYKQTNLV